MYFLFSDVHGCLNEMNELLKYWDTDREQLIYLGDMIDRGYDSFGVVKKLMDLKTEYNDKVIILRGNHDDQFIKWLKLPPYLRMYYYDENLHSTLKSFYKHNNDLKQFQKDTRKQRADYIRKNFPEVIRFMNNLPYFYETFYCIFVHAGINLNLKNWRKDKESMLWIRDEYLYSDHMSIKRIFSGHTPTRLLNDKKNDDNIWIANTGDKIVIDGGCVFGGQLNGVKINENGQILDIIKIKKKDVLNQAI